MEMWPRGNPGTARDRQGKPGWALLLARESGLAPFGTLSSLVFKILEPRRPMAAQAATAPHPDYLRELS